MCSEKRLEVEKQRVRMDWKEWILMILVMTGTIKIGTQLDLHAHLSGGVDVSQKNKIDARASK